MKIFRQALSRIQIIFAEAFGLGPAVALSAVLLIGVVTIVAVFWFIHSAPPDSITITSGDDGSRFQKNADKYAKILARNGVKLKILPSEGSLSNLERLVDPSSHVDVGFVQTGVAKGKKIDKLVSLGSISYEPLYIFYRSNGPIDFLSQFSGKRLAIGEAGTGTHVLSLELLAMNGIKPGGKTTILEIDDDASQKALLAGKVDAVFMMSDSASSGVMHDLLRTPGIRLYDFVQADAYTRRITYLNKALLPKGSIDFGRNIPDHDINLVSPTVELIARENLHPALSDLLLDAATEVHGRASLIQKRGEFPVPLEHEYLISPDATRYYKSGKSFLYRYFPFWMASLINRILVVFVPMILVLIPGLRIIPATYRWQMRVRIFRWYRALMLLEQDLAANASPEKEAELLSRLDHIERSVNRMKVPISFADQFYGLRGHIGIVRDRLTNGRR
ncbi:MAG: TAXI family TRAP transporter solute-binding subunit [Syntrophales bacterium]|nr:TAXI family TRAP transporter solute-binding subunit [Syntrophales bacterium]